MSRADSPDLVRLEGAEKTYLMGEVRVPALHPTDLAIRRGEFLVMLGPSGSGKTTLLNLIGGIDRPTSGRILFDGRDITHMGEDDITEYRRTSVGFIFQFFNLISTLTARENVEFVAELVNNPDDALDVLAEVNLGARADHFPSELSGGEQQRVAIARALVKNPTLLLADEPTGNLDYETGKMILKLLKSVNLARGITIVLVTHNSAIGEVADRVVKLRSGEIVSIEENTEPLDPESLRW